MTLEPLPCQTFPATEQSESGWFPNECVKNCAHFIALLISLLSTTFFIASNFKLRERVKHVLCQTSSRTPPCKHCDQLSGGLSTNCCRSSIHFYSSFPSSSTASSLEIPLPPMLGASAVAPTASRLMIFFHPSGMAAPTAGHPKDPL